MTKKAYYDKIHNYYNSSINPIAKGGYFMSGFGNQGPFEPISALENLEHRADDPQSPPFDDQILPGLLTNPTPEQKKQLEKLLQTKQ